MTKTKKVAPAKILSIDILHGKIGVRTSVNSDFSIKDEELL